jgi:uncharacterized RDD family membrane protein YckC
MISPGFTKRIVIMVYDSLLLVAVILLFSAPFPLLPDGWSATLTGKYLIRSYLVLVTYGFFVGFWCNGGQTLGMKAWSLRLVDHSGQSVNLRLASIRYAAAIFSWVLLGLGYLWILVDRDKLSWHDRLSGTRIVITKDS